MSEVETQTVPRNSTMDKTVVEQWMVRRVAQELRCPESEVDSAVPLMSLGIESLTLIGLAGELAELIGRDLPVEALWEHETITAISEFLVEECKEFSGETQSFDLETRSVAANAYLAEASRSSPIRPIQPRGSKAPLFLVHGIHGRTECYESLAKVLGSDQPVFGLEQRSDSPETVEEMAACLIDGLRTVQKKGPYRLAGYCFGGVIAFEMARQLNKMEQQVPLLAMVDTPSLRATPKSPVRDAVATSLAASYSMAHGPRLLVREFARDPRLVFGRFERRLGRWSHRWRLRLGLTQTAKVDQLVSEMFTTPLTITRKNLLAMRDYRPSPYEGRLSYIQSTEFRCFHGTAPSQWTKLATGGVAVCRVPGNHDDILKTPAIDYIARTLQIRLDTEAEETGTGLV